ncbi:MAG: prolipoprotein diacylglyceryl transferase family protein, partial [Verrucomicrobiota bacterium]
SQLYEAFGEGILLFVILLMVKLFVLKRTQVGGMPYNGLVAMCFIFFYAAIRFVVEFYREPDTHMGYPLWNLTQGQLLSLGMMLVGAILALVQIIRLRRIQKHGSLKTE